MGQVAMSSILSAIVLRAACCRQEHPYPSQRLLLCVFIHQCTSPVSLCTSAVVTLGHSDWGCSSLPVRVLPLLVSEGGTHGICIHSRHWGCHARKVVKFCFTRHRLPQPAGDMRHHPSRKSSTGHWPVPAEGCLSADRAAVPWPPRPCGGLALPRSIQVMIH